MAFRVEVAPPMGADVVGRVALRVQTAAEMEEVAVADVEVAVAVAAAGAGVGAVEEGVEVEVVVSASRLNDVTTS